MAALIIQNDLKWLLALTIRESKVRVIFICSFFFLKCIDAEKDMKGYIKFCISCLSTDVLLLLMLICTLSFSTMIRL